MFRDKILLIVGGTGSFGHAVLDRFLTTEIGEIRIFSRDEKKQDDMRHYYQAKDPVLAKKIKFYIGDVRDIRSLHWVMRDVDYVFHAAALKPFCGDVAVENVLLMRELFKYIEIEKMIQQKVKTRSLICDIQLVYVLSRLIVL